MKFTSRFVRLFLALVILAAIVGLSWTISSWAGGSPGSATQYQPRLIPDTDVNPYGANFFLDREVEDWKRDRTVRMAREAGIVWAKQEFSWEEIEKRKNQYDWGKPDQIVAAFEKYGLQIIARLDRPPAWAHKDKTIAQAPPDDYNDYGDFVEAFVRRYQGRVNYIQVWNEPNIFPEWGNRPVDPSGYADLLKIAYKRAKIANPNVRVLSAPLAITLGEEWAPGTNQWRYMNDLDYLDALYQTGAKDSFDILSANAFGLRSSPDEAPDPSKLNFQRIALSRAVMEKYRDTNKAVWINEYGWNAAPSDFTDDKLIWGRVTEQQQADYTVNGLIKARANWSWLGVFNVWYFRQVGDVPPERADYYFRLVDVDFTPRLVYQRLKEIATQPVVDYPGVYQETDPAVELRGNWQPLIDPLSSASREISSRQPGARATIRFWGDTMTLVMHRAPTAGRAWITLDGNKVSSLPLDTNGNSYVDLSAPNDQWQVQVPVAQAISPGTHTVEITVAQSGEVLFDGFIVAANSAREFPLNLVILFGAVFIVAFILFIVSVLRARKNSSDKSRGTIPAH